MRVRVTLDARQSEDPHPSPLPAYRARGHSYVDACLGALCAVGLASLGWLAHLEPLGLTLWCVVAAVLMLPLVLNAQRIALSGYLAAGATLAVIVAATCGWQAGIVVGAVAASLIGGTSLLTALRLPTSLAIGLTVLGASISFTWPIWAADLLTRVGTDPWLLWIVNVSPPFALNAAIAPDDPLTHRPLAYRLMNLGQDVNYAMPSSVWPCVMLHAGIGLLGGIAEFFPRRTRRDTKEEGNRSISL